MKTAEEVQSFLTQMDRRVDTGDPDLLDTGDPDEIEAGDPDGMEAGDSDALEAGDPDDADTAGPAVTAQVSSVIERFQAANGGKAPTRAQLKGLLLHAYGKGAKKRPRRPVPPSQLAVRRPLTPRVNAFRNDAFAKFRRTYPENVTTKGYYYSTAEVVFTGIGDPVGAGLALEPTTIRFFNEAIDDNAFRLVDKDGNNGIAHTVNPGETNLQYPGKNLYPRELFVITHVGLEFCGLRVMYDPTQLSSLKLRPEIVDLLSGKGTLWDDGKVFLPGELINDFDGRCRLLDAMYPSGVLYFAWKKQQSGGSRDSQELLISTMQRIPVSRMALTETSGGASLLEMHEGYVWSLEQQTAAGRYGIFQALIRTHESVTFPIIPVDIGGMKVIPKRLAAILRMTVYGDAIRPKDDVIQAPEARTRR
jgi:hypothetical protein